MNESEYMKINYSYNLALLTIAELQNFLTNDLLYTVRFSELLKGPLNKYVLKS